MLVSKNVSGGSIQPKPHTWGQGLLGENYPDSQKCCEFYVTQSKYSPEAQSAFCFIAGSLIYYECPNHFDYSIKGQPRLCLRNNGDKSWPMK